MGRPAHEPMSVARAKARLRAAGRRTGLRAWVRDAPYGAVLASTLVGFLLGQSPWLQRQLLDALLRQVPVRLPGPRERQSGRGPPPPTRR